MGFVSFGSDELSPRWCLVLGDGLFKSTCGESTPPVSLMVPKLTKAVFSTLFWMVILIYSSCIYQGVHAFCGERGP